MKLKNIVKLSVILITFMFVGINAEGEKNSKGETLSKVNGSPSRTRLNINNISTWFYNNGDSDILPSGNSGFMYPKGSNKAAVFESGFVWGATIDGQRRVGGNTYNKGILPGAIVNGAREDVDLDHVRIYRVRSDWEEGNLLAEMNDGEGSEDAIRTQYEKDWNEWPVEFGAPYEDVDGDGSYDPAIDKPGFPGANQTVWFVANDFDETTARSLYGSDPMGVELQATYWGYSLGGAFGNVIFRKYKLINKGTNVFDSMYVSMWSDPDVGDAGDDFSGCDVDRSLMFSYNGTSTDAVYGANVPAVGFDFFQGPIVAGEATDTAIFNNTKRPGFKNLPMSAHYFFINRDDVYEDPDLGEYTGTLQFHNLFRGRISGTGAPFVDPTTGEETKFTLSGDPITKTGWVDGIIHNPDDRRQGMVAGPFTMAVGDTQEIVIAEIVAGGTPGVSNLDAVAILKIYDDVAQAVYDDFFNLPPPPAIPKVQTTTLDQEIILNWGWDLDRVWDTENNISDGIAGIGEFVFQGYNVYQLPSKSATKQEAKLIATFDRIDEVKTILDDVVDPQSGVTLKNPVQYGNDNGVSRSMQIDKNYLDGAPLQNGTPYYFAVSAYSYNSDPLSIPNTLENPLSLVEVIPETYKPGEIGKTEFGEVFTAEHVNGLSDAIVTMNVIDPKTVTGSKYEIFFDEQHYYFDTDGKWKKTNFPDSVGKALNKPNDQTPSTLVPLVSIYAPNSTLDLHFAVENNAPDYNYIDAVSITFPDGIVINSANEISSNHDASPVIDGQTVTWGTPGALSTDGAFEGGEDLMVNINSVEPTFTVSYVIYDDGWSESYIETDSTYYDLGDGTVDGIGTVTLTGETGFAFKTEQHWNVRNVDNGKVVIDDQIVLSGVNYYTNETAGLGAGPIAEGVQFNIDGSYAAPLTINYLQLNDRDPVFSGGLGSRVRTNGFFVTDYTYFGDPNGTSLSKNGYGTDVQDILIQDYEFRFTGELDSIVVNDSLVYITKDGTGSMATFYGARLYDVTTHPLNTEKVDGRFLVRVPFEVWNKTTETQVNYQIYDRDQTNTAFNGFEVWNTAGRMYCEILNTPYTGELITDEMTDTLSGDFTWMQVWYESAYTTGDVLEINYANPIVTGRDLYTITSPGFTPYDATKATKDVKEVNVFPNPYYGVNPNEVNKYQRYVTFNHLPAKATLRIFNLAGQLVRTIDKDNPTQYQKWNLQNEYSLPVASGLYIVYIDMPEVGETKILKVAIIQETQILDRF